MDTAIITSLIVAGCALFGTIMSAKFVSNVRVVKLEMKMDELEQKVTKHNGLVDRMYAVEGRVKMVEHCIDESKGKSDLKYEC